MPPPKVTKCEPFAWPKHINDFEAETEFRRVTRLLGPGVTDLDLSLLVDYAVTHGEIIKLRKLVLNEGYKCIGVKGGEYLNPTVSILMHKQGHIAALRRDLFFTPKARAEKPKPLKNKTLAERLAT